jgi:hypothetical protein
MNFSSVCSEHVSLSLFNKSGTEGTPATMGDICILLFEQKWWTAKQHAVCDFGFTLD